MPGRTNSQGPQWKILIAGAVAVVVLVGAALAIMRPNAAQKAEVPIDPNATSIADAPPMPAWLAKADPLIKTEYIWASTHLAELQYIPCYCGCGHDGHTDNFACYFDRDKSGSITGYDGMSLS